MLADGNPIDLPHLPQGVQRAAAQPGNEPEPALLDLRPAEAAAPVALSPEDARRRQELIDLLQQHRGNVAAVAVPPRSGFTNIGCGVVPAPQPSLNCSVLDPRSERPKSSVCSPAAQARAMISQ